VVRDERFATSKDVGTLTLRDPFTVVLVLLLGHVFLAALMNRMPAIASLHGLGTLGMGLWWATFGRNAEQVALAGAYVAGAEVLWRMTDAQLYWEFGKYALVIIFGFALLRSFRRWREMQYPLAYLALLLPASVLTVALSGKVREDLSFNFSGPLALAAAVVFFSQLRFTWVRLRLVIWAIIIPIAGVAALAIQSSLSAGGVVSTSVSEISAITSGGFAPNQVSAALGLGAMLGLLTALHDPRREFRWLGLVVAGVLLAQSALTLSRGGLLNVLVGMGLAGAHYLRHFRLQLSLARLAIFILIGTYLIFPRLNAFTSGGLQARFQDFYTTGRADLARNDLALWWDNLLLGVGPGMSGSPAGEAAHTEFTRLLAEHGLPGLLALFLVMVMAWKAYRRSASLAARACAAALIGWSMTEMAHSAMRLAMVSFLFGLAMVEFTEDFSKARPPASLGRRRFQMEP
jgi:hypothetical protein